MPPTAAFTGSREIPHGNDNAKAAEQGPIPAHLLPAARETAAKRPFVLPELNGCPKTTLHSGEEDEIPTPQRVHLKAKPKPTAPRTPPPTLRRHAKAKPGPAPADSPKAKTATAEVPSNGGGVILDGALIAELRLLKEHLTMMVADLRDQVVQVEATMARVDEVLTALAGADKKEYKAPPDRLAKIRAAQAKRTTEERRASALKGHQKRREAMGAAAH